jgi:hypothetical protein
MGVCKRIVAGVVLVLGTAVLLLSLVAGVGVWVVKGPVTDRVTALAGRVEATLDLADRGLEKTRTSLARAAERLDGVRQEQGKLAGQPGRGNATRRLLARTVQRQVAPQLGEAQETLQAVAEAAVVVNSLLEDVGGLLSLKAPGLDVSRLTDVNHRLAEATSSAWELSRLLGETDDEADASLSRIDQTLQTIQGLLAEYEPRLAQIRQRTAELKSRVLNGITPAAYAVSFVCFWVALSQVSLLAHAWSWWRRS